VGLLRRRRWARWVAIVLLAANVVPDLVRAFGEPAIFVPIVPVAAILVYLALPVVGRTFRNRPADLAQN
jgi:membrane-anchored protein YejM (alkaline phosphatase superfamily)